MATTTTVTELKINYLTQAQYNEAKSAGTLNENEIYMTPGVDNGGLDTSDADATASDIFKDKVAYVKGERIVGTYVPSSGSGATSGSIVAAKTQGETTLFNGYGSCSAQYGSSLTSSSGTLAISSPTSVTINSSTAADVCKGKYMQVSGSTWAGGSGIVYIPSDATFTYSSQMTSTTLKVSKCTPYFILG